jgi:tRNA (mo5U34)-methyltransferase
MPERVVGLDARPALGHRGRMTADELASEVRALAPWFHNMDLGGGIWTAPDHFLGNYPADNFARFEAAVPGDLSGRSVLDIGCNAGFYSVEMARRGAARVVGIDSDPRYLAQARLAARALGFEQVEFRQMDVYQVAELGERFDFVIFMGVLYHLRHPLLALDLIREHVVREDGAGGLLLFQTLQQGSDAVADVPQDHPFFMPGTWVKPAYFDDPGYPKMHFIERAYAGDWTNWWAPNRAGSAAMLRAAGFAIVEHPSSEVFLCRAAPVPYAEHGPAAVYPSRGGTPA